MATKQTPKLNAQTIEKINAHFEMCKRNGKTTTGVGRRKIYAQMASYIIALCDFDIITPVLGMNLLLSGSAWIKNPEKPFLGKYANKR